MTPASANAGGEAWKVNKLIADENECMLYVEI